MDFEGSILQTFFDTWDSEDATKFTDALDKKIQSDEIQLTQVIKDNIDIIKSIISTFNQCMSNDNENEKNMQIMEEPMTKVSNLIVKLEVKSQLNSVTNSLDIII